MPLTPMPHTLTRFVAIVLLLVQATASLGRGGSLCVPLDPCGESFAAHSHDHGSHSVRAVVAHRHATGERRPAAERVHHACDHDHGPAEAGDGHSHDGGDAFESGEHRACCGDHLHLNLIDHELPPRSGSATELLAPSFDLPATGMLARSEGAIRVPLESTIDAAWIRSDQRRTIDVASIVV
jgi:hypothetical protein